MTKKAKSEVLPQVVELAQVESANNVNRLFPEWNVETITTTDWEKIGDIKTQTAYITANGLHVVEVMKSYNGADGLAHSHFVVAVDGVEFSTDNENAKFNGQTTVWSPALKHFLASDCDTIKVQAVRYKTTTESGRSLYDLTKVLPSNYEERAIKALEACSAAIEKANKQLAILNGIAPNEIQKLTFADFTPETAETTKTVVLEWARQTAQANETKVATRESKAITQKVANLSEDAKKAMLLELASQLGISL